MASNYEKLVKALRCRETEWGYYTKCEYYGEASDNRCVLCDSDRLAKDAAAAIEALQARLGEAENSVERWKDMYLTKHEPKRGEFEKSLHEMFDSIWDCDINHPIFQDTVGELMEAVLQAYDTVNTAKMEVQE